MVETRRVRRARIALTLAAPYLYKNTEVYASDGQFMPTLERTSFQFNVFALTSKFGGHMHRVQARLKDGVVGNRAKLNYLKLLWEEQKDKLTFQFIQKNKKKEYNQIISDISGID